ncbi:Hypp9187 [Branchiostoma lanceolatum]|uniref:Hypp9187 protein n=1 Tax=Branchiostoma lanceolatum TaxID=7740 RepID=A0A8J9ZCA7_BRALA|nr:Hypp9187 [Branchiostoma lanceolatum]
MTLSSHLPLLRQKYTRLNLQSEGEWEDLQAEAQRRLSLGWRTESDGRDDYRRSRGSEPTTAKDALSSAK